MNGLAAGHANSVESHTVPLGQGATVPSADNVSTVQVTPQDVVPTVKPATQVLPTDAVIDPNAPPPTGPQPVTTPTYEYDHDTTSTTTNPDGSTTTQHTEEPGVMSCSIGNHDQRTFGSVLQEHLTRWQGSGLAGALNLIKNLTWPDTIPIYTLNSSLFGTFTLDFSGWSGILGGTARPRHCDRLLRRLSHHLCGVNMTALLNLIYCFLMDMIQSFRDVWVIGFDSLLTPG